MVHKLWKWTNSQAANRLQRTMTSVKQHLWSGIPIDCALVGELLAADRDICKDRHHSELPNLE